MRPMRILAALALASLTLSACYGDHPGHDSDHHHHHDHGTDTH
jgi:hypothetical protein